MSRIPNYPRPLDDLISFSSTSWEASIKEGLSGLNFSAAIEKFAQLLPWRQCQKLQPITKTEKPETGDEFWRHKTPEEMLNLSTILICVNTSYKTCGTLFYSSMGFFIEHLREGFIHFFGLNSSWESPEWSLKGNLKKVLRKFLLVR